MSITGITKRIACFYDNKGDYLGKKAFSNTEKVFDYAGCSFNVVHEDVTITKLKRWYWNLDIYHYNINNPMPLDFKKTVEPIIDSELYNIQLKTKVARDLNDLSKTGLQLNAKTILIGIGILVIGWLVMTGKIKLS